MSDDPLSTTVRALFGQLRHAGDLSPSAGARVLTGEAGQEALGTRVRFALAVGEGHIRAVRYRAYGCPFTLATCEWLSSRLEGRPATAPGIDGPLDWVRELDIPADRIGRLLVIEDALQAALTCL